MKTIKYLQIAILAIGVTACSDNDDPFSGTDNFIKSFTLTQGDTTYQGVLEGDSVIVQFAGEVYAQGMEATIELSENASISPKPEDIDNWLEEQLFVVTSYNGSRRTYRYMPKVGYITHQGDIVLRTQEDVDNFPGLGITSISGNLIIGNSTGEDSIASVAPLSALRKVDYDVIVNSCYKGETLTLEALEEAGSITIKSSVDFGIVSFPRLRKVSLTANFGALYQLSCPNLEIVGKDLQVSNKSTMYYALNFPNLKKVEGTLAITNTSWLINTFSLPKLEEVGTINLSFHANNISLPALKVVSTGLSISGDKVLAIDLPVLQKGGQLTLSTSNLIKLNIPVLQEAGNISYSNLKITDIDFPKLEKAGNISLSAVPAIERLSFPVLERAGNVSFSSTTNLRNLNLGAANIDNLSFSSFDTIRVEGTGIISGTLSVSSQIAYCKVKGIKTMGTVQSTSSATYLECPDLEHLTSSLSVAHRDHGKTLFPNLSDVGGNMTFQCYSVEAINVGDIDFGKLETVAGRLSISGYNNAPEFRNLDMFASLTSAQSITISNLKALTDYAGLKKVIPSITAAGFTATGNAYNPTYQDLVNGEWTN